MERSILKKSGKALSLPKSRRAASHVLSQRAHHTVGPCTIAEDVEAAEDESHYQANGFFARRFSFDDANGDKVRGKRCREGTYSLREWRPFSLKKCDSADF